jgi:hypothetical protein
MSDFLEQPGGDNTPPDSAGAASSGSAIHEPSPNTLEALSAEGDELQTQQPVVFEEEEIEHEGKKFKIPKELKDAFMLRGDYTQKTQAVAETRRELETQRQEFQQNVQTQQQFMQEYARVTAIDDRLQQLMGVNWQQLNAQNPQQAQALHLEFTQLQTARGQLVGNLTARQTQMREAQQREIAKRASDAEAILKREIKDWSPEKDRQLAAYTAQIGLDPQFMGQVGLQAPQLFVVLSKAQQFDQLMKDRTKAPTPPAPGTRVGGANASTAKPLGDVTDPAEWQKRREARKGRNR